MKKSELRQLIKEGIGYELYARGADRISHMGKNILANFAEKVAKATRENKSLAARKKLIKELEKWANAIQTEVRHLRDDVNNLEGYKE